MSEHNPHQGHDRHGQEREQVESSVLQPRPVLLFLVILFVATAFVFVIVKGLDFGLRKLDESNQGQAATQVETRGRQLPPEPLLQGAPGKDDKPTDLPLDEMGRVRKETSEKLNSYGWVDKSGGVARIPIDRAKEMLAEKGLPALPSATISDELQKAETVRKEILNAESSAGRIIKTPGQNQQQIQRPAQPQEQNPQQDQKVQRPAQPQEQKPQQDQKVPPQEH
jgi:hypothetical protein